MVIATIPVKSRITSYLTEIPTGRGAAVRRTQCNVYETYAHGS